MLEVSECFITAAATSVRSAAHTSIVVCVGCVFQQCCSRFKCCSVSVTHHNCHYDTSCCDASSQRYEMRVRLCEYVCLCGQN